MRETNQHHIFQHYAHIAPKLTFSHHRSAVADSLPENASPTPSANSTGGNIPAERVDGNFVPDGEYGGIDAGLGFNDELVGRDSSDIIGNGMYGDYTMIERAHSGFLRFAPLPSPAMNAVNSNKQPATSLRTRRKAVAGRPL